MQTFSPLPSPHAMSRCINVLMAHPKSRRGVRNRGGEASPGHHRGKTLSESLGHSTGHSSYKLKMYIRSLFRYSREFQMTPLEAGVIVVILDKTKMSKTVIRMSHFDSGLAILDLSLLPFDDPPPELSIGKSMFADDTTYLLSS